MDGRGVLRCLVCSVFVMALGSAIKVEDHVLFDKSIPEFEDVLNADDFSRAPYVTSDGLEEDNAEQYRDDLFEGDISNTNVNSSSVEQFVSQGATTIDDPLGVMHNAIKNRYQMWPNRVVPYAISSRYSSYSRSRIAAAMQDYARRTCIQFIPRTSQHRNYLYIIPDTGCYSMVGRTGGRQTLSLGSGCVQKGIIIHELMHAVGFFHEQSRADRDKFIRINWHNIRYGMQGQFTKYSLRTIQHLGAPYDYQSVMHYGPRAFSTNGQPTITPLRSGARIGQRSGFSATDALKINTLYQCDGPSGVITARPRTTSRPTATRPPVVRPRPATRRPTGGRCRDLRSDCGNLRRQNWCSRNVQFMRQFCPATCNLCGPATRRPVTRATFRPITRATRRPITRVTRRPVTRATFRPVTQAPIRPSTPPTGSCRDAKDWCGRWARAGFCNGLFRGYMQRNCGKSCGFCTLFTQSLNRRFSYFV